MTALENFQFEILPDAEANDGFVFGIGAHVSLDDGGFDPGEAEWIDQTTQNTRRGVRSFGRDVLGAQTWVWSSHVNRSSTKEAVETLEQFSAFWRPEALMRQPGAQVALRYRLAGRDRRIFGRPRRYSAPPTNLILGGYVPVTHDFALTDSYTYDDVASEVNVPFSSSATGGGFELPATMPITTLPSAEQSGQIFVGGNARTYPVIRFNGPWTNPGFITDDWALRWTGSIPADDWVEIDTRPWVLTVTDKAGASKVSGLERRTWLEDCWFAPQAQPQYVLTGSAPGGGAVATIRWRAAWTSI